MPPKKGKKHVLRVISEILSFQPQSPRTDLGAGLEFLGRVARRRAVAFLISDFLAPLDELRAGAAHHRAPPRPDPGDASPIRWRRRCPTSGSSSSRTSRPARSCVFDTSGPEARALRARRARAPPRRAQALFRRLRHGLHQRAHRPAVPAGADHLLRGARAEAAALRRPRAAPAARCARAGWPALGAAPASRARAAADAGAAGGAPIPTRRRSRRAPTSAEAHVGDPITVSVTAIGTARRAGQPARRRWSSGRSRCSIARRAEQDLGDGRVRREFTLTVAAYEPGAGRAPADRGDLPRPARRRAHGADGAGRRSRSPA